jgi:hypothetical protein
VLFVQCIGGKNSRIFLDESQEGKLKVRACLDPRANGKRANGKIFAPVTSDVWMLIRSIKYSLIKKLIT